MPKNAIFGWALILASILSGLVMGIRFQREEWLGGYSSLPRRMVRLAHIAMAALGMLNVLYASSTRQLALSPELLSVASVSFMAGGVLMPLACLWLAIRRRNYAFFSLPIMALLTGVALTLRGLL